VRNRFPHGFGRLVPMQDQSFSLELLGAAPTAYKSFFDLYLLEASRNLMDWAPLDGAVALYPEVKTILKK
jgi:hypothetical protein